MLNEIFWPEEYLPGTTDNFASNEIIVKGLKTEDVWPYLTHIQSWETYYENCSNAMYAQKHITELSLNAQFSFQTFGFEVKAQVTEFKSPENGLARISWHGWVEGDISHRLDVIHAWLLEELSGNRLRILTQESQIGRPAADMAGTNIMINGHQSWLYGLVKAAQGKYSLKSDLYRIID